MSVQAVFAAVRTFVEEVKAGGPAKGQAAQAAKPADVAAQAAAAKAEAESRAQVCQPRLLVRPVWDPALSACHHACMYRVSAENDRVLHVCMHASARFVPF